MVFRSLLMLMPALLLVLSAGQAGAMPAPLVCSAIPDEAAPAGFAQGPCEEGSYWTADPQLRPIWLVLSLEADPALLRGPAPAGLAVSAKASSAAFLNGRFIGANGRPGMTARAEEPGAMDVVLPIPPGVLQPGANELRLLMSSENGFLHLQRPIHRIGLVSLATPWRMRIGRSWIALASFGAFAAGSAYFGVQALVREGRGTSLLLAGLCLFAGAQLLAEAARSLYAYPYPLHDVRLVAITLFAAGFGLTLCAYVLREVGTERPSRALALIALSMAGAAFTVPGFDNKTVAVLVIAAAGAAAGAAWAIRRGRRRAIAPFIALAAFLAAIMTGPFAFLDRDLFLAIAALILFLLIRQARLLAATQTARETAGAQAAALSVALEQARREEKAPQRLSLAGHGAVDSVPLDDIAFVKAAGDYAEAHLCGGGQRLAGKRLSEIEAALPSTFLRVHRSFLVNLAKVRRLERHAAGTGSLFLADGSEIPVSRRIMPKVRKTLAGGADGLTPGASAPRKI